MNEQLASILTGTSGLAVIALAALSITIARPAIHEDHIAISQTARAMLISVAVQSMHFIEELTTGFHERFPLLLGLRSWPATFFVAFNLAWILIWITCARSLRSHWRVVLFPCWFLALALIVNAVVHPLLALRVGGYFPGLLTSPLAGAAGVWLTLRLVKLTPQPVEN